MRSNRFDKFQMKTEPVVSLDINPNCKFTIKATRNKDKIDFPYFVNVGKYNMQIQKPSKHFQELIEAATQNNITLMIEKLNLMGHRGVSLADQLYLEDSGLIGLDSDLDSDNDKDLPIENLTITEFLKTAIETQTNTMFELGASWEEIAKCNSILTNGIINHQESSSLFANCNVIFQNPAIHKQTASFSSNKVESPLTKRYNG